MQLSELSRTVENSPDLQRKMSEDPAGMLKTLGAMPLQTDVWIYRTVVGMLGLVVIITVVASTVLSFYDKSIPEGLYVLAGTCAGAMAGLLAPSPNR